MTDGATGNETLSPGQVDAKIAALGGWRGETFMALVGAAAAFNIAKAGST